MKNPCIRLGRSSIGAAFVVCTMASSSAAPAAAQANDRDERPRLTLRARPDAVLAPGRVVLTAELTGGADDFRELYCPTVEWDWGDDTTSEASGDCDPYEPQTSKIRRRYTVEHIFRQEGRYRVYIRLKQRDATVGAASVDVNVAPGRSRF